MANKKNKLKKIGIVTIYGNNNYGNKLQNYAIEKIYINHGFTVKTIRYKNYYTNNFVKNIIISMIEIRNYKKNRVFYNFSNQYLNLSKKKFDFNKNGIWDYLNTFDFVSVGSDQVWNDAYLSQKMLDYFLLNGVEAEKRIASAPSIGGDRISNKDKFKEELRKFKKLSCREKENIEELKQLANKEVVHLMDPTLAISKKEWENLLLNSKLKFKNKYIFEFILGSSDTNFCKNELKNIDIINVLNKNDFHYFSGPIEFIDLIKNAELIITDSFHCTVFSIIFRKNFVVLNRDTHNMGNRIKNLLEYFSIPCNNKNIYIPSKIVDYDKKIRLIRESWSKYIETIN